MLLALETAIVDLLKSALPALFTGAGAATASFPLNTWDFDPLSADPVAGQPGPEDAVDELPFNAAAPAGPYTLTRPPYPGPKRVYLHSAAGELVALGNTELVWNPANPAAFSLAPRPGRELSGFAHLQVLYGVVAAATRFKTKHKLALEIGGSTAAAAEQALALALAVLVLNRDTLMAQASSAWNSGNYQAKEVVKGLKFSSGSAAAPTSRSLLFEAEVELRVERLLGPDEGKPIRQILSPGKTPGSKSVDIDPAVQA